MTSWDLLYNILRANFDGTKSAYCPVPPEEGDGKGIYDYGHTFKSVREVDKDHVEVIYLNKEGKEQTSTVDLLIGSDGASSTLRRMLRPDVTRSYAGYVAWRGTVLESSVSEAARNTFVEQITYFHTKGQQILAYTIPGKNGTLEVGQRLINFVWYCNYPEDSESYNELMTDSDGQKHRITLPAGKIRSEVWEKQKQFARDTLPPQFAEIVTDCQQPFIQAIGDVPPSENVFFGGKVLMIGDAFSGFRPHAAASTNQAALDSLLLGEKLEGKISLEEWKQKTFEYAAETQKHSVSIGDLSQYGEHPLDGMKVQ
ncbi:hypothetical protein MMC25_008226 [Agyrium rufum]|nr:hypothetical protein [Agyrium rufum]